MIAFKNYEKWLFHLKKNVRSQEIQIFEFFSSSFLPPISHCLKT